MKHLEHDEQVLLMKWWELACKGFGIANECLFAIPNGGLRNVVTACNLKREGVRAGVPDIFLAVARGEFHGMFIEMKKKKGGRVSEAQKRVGGVLIGRGYFVCICHGWDEARSKICWYLSLAV